MTPLPCPSALHCLFSGPQAAPPRGGGSWFPGQRLVGNGGEGWYSCWGGLTGSICHPGCPVNYSAAGRTDSLPSQLLLRTSCCLLFASPPCLCLGGLNTHCGPRSSGCSFLGTFESLSYYYNLFVFLSPLSHCLAVASLLTTVLSAPILGQVK